MNKSYLKVRQLEIVIQSWCFSWAKSCVTNFAKKLLQINKLCMDVNSIQFIVGVRRVCGTFYHSGGIRFILLYNLTIKMKLIWTIKKMWITMLFRLYSVLRSRMQRRPTQLLLCISTFSSCYQYNFNGW